LGERKIKINSIIFGFRNKSEFELALTLIRRFFEDPECPECSHGFSVSESESDEKCFEYRIKIGRDSRILSPTFFLSDFFCKEMRLCNDIVEYFIVK
jgi:hypothetical protein